MSLFAITRKASKIWKKRRKYLLLNFEAEENWKTRRTSLLLNFEAEENWKTRRKSLLLNFEAEENWKTRRTFLLLNFEAEANFSDHTSSHCFCMRLSERKTQDCLIIQGRLWVLQHCCLEAYFTLTRMSSSIHLQKRCTHQAAWETSASEGRNYTWN